MNDLKLHGKNKKEAKDLNFVRVFPKDIAKEFGISAQIAQ